jgi:integrase
LAPATLKKYRAAAAEFLQYLEQHGLFFDTAEECDLLLMQYITYLYMTHRGAGKSKAITTYAGIIHYKPAYKGQLLETTLTLKAWERDRPPVSWRALTWDVTLLMAERICSRGAVRAAIGILLAFDCYLRISELLALRTTDIIDSDLARNLGSVYKGMSIALRTTKTGRNQWVTVEDPHVRKLVRYVLDNTAPGEHLFPYTAAQVRALIREAGDHFGLAHFHFTTHSLRHGGATRDFLAQKDTEWIRLRGRWASIDSLQRYLHADMVMLIGINVPPQLERHAAQLCRDAYRAVLDAIPR